MTDNLYEIDLAMHMIKEDVIRELSESVSRKKTDSCINDISSSSLSFSEKRMD